MNIFDKIAPFQASLKKSNSNGMKYLAILNRVSLTRVCRIEILNRGACDTRENQGAS